MYEAKHNLNPRDFANTFKEINDKYPTRYSKNNFEKPKATRHGSRTAATSKMERFVIIVNYYHKALHLGCCSSPRSASGNNQNHYFCHIFSRTTFLEQLSGS